MNKYPKPIHDRMEVWRWYGVGIPSYVPVGKRGAVEACCGAICAVLEADAAVRADYEADQKGKVKWHDVLLSALERGQVAFEAAEVCLKLARAKGLLDEFQGAEIDKRLGV